MGAKEGREVEVNNEVREGVTGWGGALPSGSGDRGLPGRSGGGSLPGGSSDGGMPGRSGAGGSVMWKQNWESAYRWEGEW